MFDSLIANSEIKIDNYIVYHTGRNRRDGGVASFLNKSLNSTEIDLNLSTEYIRVKVKLKKQVLILASMYPPPKSPVDYYDFILDDVEKNYICSFQCYNNG